MKQPDPIETFATLARKYCEWVERPAGSPHDDVLKALVFLPNLYVCAQDLPERYGDEEAASISHDRWRDRYKRFVHLELSSYNVCFNPHAVPPEPPVAGDIADDLADIWRDLRPALDLYDAGLIDAAVWDWRHQFQMHWGKHVASALYALHCWEVELGVR